MDPDVKKRQIAHLGLIFDPFNLNVGHFIQSHILYLRHTHMIVYFRPGTIQLLRGGSVFNTALLFDFAEG